MLTVMGISVHFRIAERLLVMFIRLLLHQVVVVHVVMFVDPDLLELHHVNTIIIKTYYRMIQMVKLYSLVIMG